MGQEKADEATRQAIERFAKEHPELVEGLRNTGDVALFLADFTPIVGDIKPFAEAEDGIDYALAFISIVPGTEAVTKPLKKAKSALQKAKEAERLGNSAEALKYQREVAKQLDYVQDNANLGRNRSGFNFLLNENINSKIKSINPPKLIFDKSKYDYLFGNVRFDIHNSSRAFQNKQQLSSIGIYNDQRGRNIIEKTLEKMLSDKVYVKESFSKNINGKYQNFEIRESIIIGSGGIRKIEVTFEVMNDGSRRFITTILKGGN